MMQNFIFRSAVNGAALWNLLQKLHEEKKPEKKMLAFYDNGSKIKTVFK